MDSPFSFGRAVKSESFTNRESEIKKLASNFTNNINTIIISPRRWGKSSLVEKVTDQVRSRQLKVVKLDLFSIRTEEEFYHAFGNAVIKATSGKIEEWLLLAKKFIRSVTPKFTVELGDKQSFDMSLDMDVIKKHAKELLDLPEKIAKEKKVRLVICIDEFQNVSTFADSLGFQKKLRSAWQHHQHVCYCLYGSRQHMLMALFNKPSHPFYRFGELMLLPRIAREKWVTYITRQFKKTGRSVSAELARSMARLVKDNPYYVQQLAHLCWTRTTKTMSREVLSAALNDIVNQNAILYSRELEELNNTELRLLRAVCAGAVQYSSKETMDKFGLGTSANVVKTRRSLVSKEIAGEEQGQLFLLDPVFELWFRQQVLGEELLTS